MYGEESRKPTKVIPQATMLSVVGVGIFYVVVSWAALVGTGPSRAVALAQDPATGGNIFFGVVEQNIGGWAVVLFEFLLMTGSYACGMAFHNCASRYIYAIGREDLLPGLGRTLGRTHPKHGSPYVAGFVQTAISATNELWFFFTGRDPYAQLFALMGLSGTTAILIVQALAAFACIAYFHGHGKQYADAHWFRTFVAPLLGGIGMLYAIYLLIDAAGVAAGAAANDIVFILIPWVVGFVGIAGVAFALFVKWRSPARYELVGRVVLDVREREGAIPPPARGVPNGAAPAATSCPASDPLRRGSCV
jgi:amino acid transporter